MVVGDVVFQNFGSIHRYGKVKEVLLDMKGDGWKWVKIDWIDDEKFEQAMRWKSKLRNVDQDEFIPEYYRCDDIQRINIGKVLSTLEKIANA